MATKTKSKAQNQTVKKDAPQYSFEFLNMLAETGVMTLTEYLKKTNAPKDVVDLVDLVSCLNIEMTTMLEGGGQNTKNVADYVLQTVSCISSLGGTFYGPIGSVTPLQERMAVYQESKK